MLQSYPSLSWVRNEIRNNLIYPLRKTILHAYIVGSEAKRTSNENSDLDIAIVIQPIRGKTSLKYTERYQQKFINDMFKPKWENRVVDFQFFYNGCPELEQYEKIKIY